MKLQNLDPSIKIDVIIPQLEGLSWMLLLFDTLQNISESRTTCRPLLLAAMTTRVCRQGSQGCHKSVQIIIPEISCHFLQVLWVILVIGLVLLLVRNVSIVTLALVVVQNLEHHCNGLARSDTDLHRGVF